MLSQSFSLNHLYPFFFVFLCWLKFSCQKVPYIQCLIRFSFHTFFIFLSLVFLCLISLLFFHLYFSCQKKAPYIHSRNSVCWFSFPLSFFLYLFFVFVLVIKSSPPSFSLLSFIWFYSSLLYLLLVFTYGLTYMVNLLFFLWVANTSVTFLWHSQENYETFL